MDSDSSSNTDINGLCSDYEKYVSIQSKNLKRKPNSLMEIVMKKQNYKGFHTVESEKLKTRTLADSSLKSFDKNSFSSSDYQDKGYDTNDFSGSEFEPVHRQKKTVRIAENATISKDNLVFENDKIKSGTFDAIVDHLIDTLDDPEESFLFATLLSMRIFIAPYELFRYAFSKILQDKSAYGIYKYDDLTMMFHKSILLLNEWTQLFPYDFREQNMMDNYKEITHKLINMNINLKEDVISITSNLLINIRNLELYETYLNKIHSETAMKLQTSLLENDVLCICENPHVLARQLTHIELDRLRHISAEEFLQDNSEANTLNSSNNYGSKSSLGTYTSGQFDNKLDSVSMKSSASSKSSKQNVRVTSNIDAYIQWFNRLSNFVNTEVVKHYKRDKRVKVIKYFIEVALECFNMGNFNSTMAIIASLGSQNIQRLKQTWSKIDTTTFDYLQKQLDINKNFCNYRQLLNNAKIDIKENKNRIVVPLFAVVMKDITSLKEGISHKIDNGHINFEKFWSLAKYISEMLNLKNLECRSPQECHIINYLLTAPLLTNDGCKLASYECEPPEAINERNYRDQLRSKLRESMPTF